MLGFAKFDMDETMSTMFLRETVDCVGPMLFDTTRKVVRHPDIERVVPPARKDIDAGTSHVRDHATERRFWPLGPRFRGDDNLQ